MITLRTDQKISSDFNLPALKLAITLVDLNGTMSTGNYFLLSLLVLTYFLHFPSSEYL